MTSATKTNWLFAGAWVLLLSVGAPNVVDLDSWHQMALAREALALGYLPLEDRFSYTPTIHPCVQHEWGNGFVLLFLGQFGGLIALQALRTGLVTILVNRAVRAARGAGASIASLILLAPLAAMMAWIGLTAVRAQLFTLMFLAVWLSWFAEDRRGRHGWIALASLTLFIWENVHAGFVVGLAFLGLHGFEQWLRGGRIRHIVVLLAMAAPILLLTPYGWLYPRYLAHALLMPRPLISEWRPIWEASTGGFAIWSVAAATGVLALLRAGPRRAHGCLLFLAATVLSAQHERHVSIFALVWFVSVPTWLSQTQLGVAVQRGWEAPWRPAIKAAATVVLATTLALFLKAQPWKLSVPGTNVKGSSYSYPVGAVEYIAAQQIDANVMLPFEVGAFVSWKLSPRVKVSLDSRYEVAYPPERLVEHLRFYKAEPGWQELLTRWPTDLVLARRTNDRLIEAMASEQPQWPRVYEDDAYVMFARPGLNLPSQDRRGQIIVGTFP